MEKSVDYRPAKRPKTSHEQNSCSTFEWLSADLILTLFEYFNTKEILQSFSNLTSLITSCIFDRRQQLHVHLDRQMSSLLDNYSPDRVISLHIEHVVIPIGTFLNLKSLSIVHGDEHEDECLNMINEICKLSQLINFTLSLVGSELTSISHKMIETALCHSSLQRIILSKSLKPQFDSCYRDSSVKLIFPSVKLVYVTSDFHGEQIEHLSYYLGRTIIRPLTPQYHVRCLDLDFKSATLYSLVELLSTLPLLITLKIKGCACCNPALSWLHINTWNQMLQKLKALQRVDIDIYLARPISPKTVQTFNKRAAQEIQTCKRINLTAGPRTKQPGLGCIQISASLNMD